MYMQVIFYITYELWIIYTAKHLSDFAEYI